MADEEKQVDQSVEEAEPTPEDVLGAEAFEEAEPTEEPIAEEKPTEDETPAEAKPDDTQPEKPETEDVAEAEAKADDEPAIELVSHKVIYSGQEFEIQVTPEQAKVLDAQHKTALQTPHLQKLYTEAKEANERAAAMAQTTTPATTTPAGGGEAFNSEEFVKRMEPAVRDAVDRGAISEEFHEMYPTEAANYAWAGMQLDHITKALTPVVRQYAESALDGERSRVKAETCDGMARLASDRPELYGDLSDQNARESLFNFMIDMNLDVNLLRNEVLTDTLEKMWGSYQGPKIIEAARAASEQAKQQQAEKLRLAAGGGGGGGGRSAPANDALADITATFSER